MPIEDDHPDVMQNIEFVVVAVFRNHKDMPDYDVLRVYEDLLDDYTNELRGRPIKNHKHADVEAQLYQDIRAMCEWRLGRNPNLLDGATSEPDAIDIPTLIRCLKRLIKSVHFWNKNNGRQGYLNYMSEFIA